MTHIVIRDGEAFADPDPAAAEVAAALDDSGPEVARSERQAGFDHLMSIADQMPDPVVDAGSEQATPGAKPPGGGDSRTARKPPLDATLSKLPPLVRVRLTWPLTIDGRRIREVSLWPPSHAAVEDVAKGRMSLADMVTRMAGLPDGALGCMRIDDSDRIVSIALFLAPEGLQP